MKIKYNVKSKNNFKVFNDSMGIALNRESIIRNRKVRYLGYLKASVIELEIALLFLCLMIIVQYTYPCTLSTFLTIFATISFIVMIISVLYPLLFATFFTSRDENELEINEKGISFYFDDDQCITLGWTKIRALVIGKYSMNFITDEPYYFYIDKKYRLEVIKAIKEYNKSLLIIK